MDTFSGLPARLLMLMMFVSKYKQVSSQIHTRVADIILQHLHFPTEVSELCSRGERDQYYFLVKFAQQNSSEETCFYLNMSDSFCDHHILPLYQNFSIPVYPESHQNSTLILYLKKKTKVGEIATFSFLLTPHVGSELWTSLVGKTKIPNFKLLLKYKPTNKTTTEVHSRVCEPNEKIFESKSEADGRVLESPPAKRNGSFLDHQGGFRKTRETSLTSDDDTALSKTRNKLTFQSNIKDNPDLVTQWAGMDTSFHPGNNSSLDIKPFVQTPATEMEGLTELDKLGQTRANVSTDPDKDKYTHLYNSGGKERNDTSGSLRTQTFRSTPTSQTVSRSSNKLKDLTPAIKRSNFSSSQTTDFGHLSTGFPEFNSSQIKFNFTSTNSPIRSSTLSEANTFSLSLGGNSTAMAETSAVKDATESSELDNTFPVSSINASIFETTTAEGLLEASTKEISRGTVRVGVTSDINNTNPVDGTAKIIISLTNMSATMISGQNTATPGVRTVSRKTTLTEETTNDILKTTSILRMIDTKPTTDIAASSKTPNLKTMSSINLRTTSISLNKTKDFSFSSTVLNNKSTPSLFSPSTYSNTGKVATSKPFNRTAIPSTEVISPFRGITTTQSSSTDGSSVGSTGLSFKWTTDAATADLNSTVGNFTTEDSTLNVSDTSTTTDGYVTFINLTTEKTVNTTQNLVFVSKRQKSDNATFWPIVMTLVIGVPAIIVFSIAITVILKKRKVDTSTFFIAPPLTDVEV